MFIIRVKFYNKKYYLSKIMNDGMINYTLIQRNVKKFDTKEAAQECIDQYKIKNAEIIEK